MKWSPPWIVCLSSLLASACGNVVNVTEVEIDESPDVMEDRRWDARPDRSTMDSTPDLPVRHP